MLHHVCAIPQRSSRVTNFRRFVGAMSGGGRWPRMPGRAAVAFRQRGLHPVGRALGCPQLAHHRKELEARYCIAEATCCAPGSAAVGQRH